MYTHVSDHIYTDHAQPFICKVSECLPVRFGTSCNTFSPLGFKTAWCSWIFQIPCFFCLLDRVACFLLILFLRSVLTVAWFEKEQIRRMVPWSLGQFSFLENLKYLLTHQPSSSFSGNYCSSDYWSCLPRGCAVVKVRPRSQVQFSVTPRSGHALDLNRSLRQKQHSAYYRAFKLIF